MFTASETTNPIKNMASEMWVGSCVAAVLSLALLVLLSRALLRQKLNLPPGPKPWPIIGNLMLLGPLPHRSLHILSQKYGPLMHLWLGSQPTIVVSSAEMAKQVLKTHDALFASRPPTAAGRYTGYNSSNMTWSPYGAYWRQARKLYAIELVSARRLDSFEYIRVEEVGAFVSDLFNKSGNPIDLGHQLSFATLNIISRLVLGKKYIDESDVENALISPKDFRKMLDEVVLVNGWFSNIGDYIPWIGFLDLQGYVKRMKTVSRKFDQFLEHVISEHSNRRLEREDWVPKDMVDVMLEQADEPNLEIKLSRENVKALTMEAITGGTDTSSLTVNWAISELLKHPHMLGKAWAELDAVVGKERWVEDRDMDRLVYLDAIIKETLRLHPAGPILTPHFSRENCKINGYDIQSGTRVLVSVWSIMRDPTTWDSPEEFLPERFFGLSVDIKGQDFNFLPFGAGRRLCPAYNLGMKNVQLVLANLLHGFHLKLPGKMTPEELAMDEICGLNTRRNAPLMVTVEPRLPSHLYIS